MATDIGTLYIKVDSHNVVTASKDLDELAGRAKKTETATQSMSSSFEKLKQNWIAVTAAAVAFGMAMQKAMDYMDLGAKALQSEATFKNLAQVSGESADKILANLTRITNGTIDDSLLMQKASKALMLDFTGAQIEQMAEMARMGARVTGETVAQVFDNIVNAISTNMPRGLKQYGLVTKEQMNMVSQAMSAGITGIDLYSMAMSNFSVQQAKMGKLYTDEAEKMQQYKAKIDETKESIGKLLIVATGFSLGMVSEATGRYAAILASIVTRSTAPLKARASDAVGIPEAQAEADRAKARLTQATDQKTAEEKRKLADEETMRQIGAVQQHKSALEAMKVLDTNYFTQRSALITNIEEVAIINGQNEFTAKKATIDAMKALDVEYRSKTLAENQAEDDTRTETDKKQLSSAVFIHDKVVALDADMATRINERNLAEIKLNAEKNLAIYTSTGEMYMAINQYSQESTDFQIAEIKRLAAQKTITSSGGVSGNEVAVAQWEADQIIKIYAAKDNAMVTADLAMWNEINSHSREAMKLQVTLWEAEAAEYIRRGHEKGLVEDWLNAKKLQYDQDWLKTEIDFYSQLKGYEDTYRTLQLEWIDREEKVLAGKYKDDLAAFKWAQQEKLKLNTELSKSNIAAATPPPEKDPLKELFKGYSTNQPFQMTWASYIGPLTDAVVQLLNKNQKAIDYAAKAPEREAAAKAAADAAKATADAAAQVAQAAADVAAAAEAKAQDILKQGIGLSIQIMELTGDAAGALAVTRAQELAAMDESLRPLQQRIYNLQDEATATDLANKKQALNIQIMTLTGDATGALAAQRAIELAAMDESLRPLQERIYALQDEAKWQNLQIQLMTLTGDAAAALAAQRKIELAAMDESLQGLQKWIYAITDAKDAVAAAQDALKKSFDAEKTRLTDVYNAQLTVMNTNLSNTKTIISDLTSNVNMLQSAKDSMAATDSTTSYAAAKSALAMVLQQARGGNLSGVSGLSTSLNTLTGASANMFSSSEDYKRSSSQTYNSIAELQTLTGKQLTTQETTAALLQTQIDDAKINNDAQLTALDSQLNALLGINTNVLSVVDATIALAAANTELLKLISQATKDTATYTSNLDRLGIKAIFDLTQVLTLVDNSAGLPEYLKKMIVAQAGDYKLWLQAQLDSTVSEPIKRVLIDGAGIYTATVKAIAGTIDAKSQKLAIDAGGEYKAIVNSTFGTADANATKLALIAQGEYEAKVKALFLSADPNSQKLAIDAAGEFTAKVKAAFLSADPTATKLALTATGDYTAKVNAVFSSADASSQKLAITALGNYQTTVNAAMGLADVASQKLALTAAGSYLSTVNASLGIVDADSRKLALTSTGGYLTTVTAAMGIADTESRKLALTAVGTFLTTVNAVIGTVNADARTLGLTATNTLNTTINAALGVVNADAKKLALDTTNTINATINAAMGTTNATAQALGLNASNTLAATVTASLGYTEPGAKELAMNTVNSIAANVTAALGSGNETALMLATAQSTTLETLVSATLTGSVANQLSGLLTGIAASDLVTLGGTVTWENSLLNYIKNATELTAANTGRYATLEHYDWTLYNAAGGAIGVSHALVQYGMTAEQINTAIQTARPMFAEGGIATGSDSGYAATLHGTELVVSPRASYPATVRGNGNDNVILIEEVRALRAEMKAGNYQIVKNTGKAAKILDNTLTKWDDLGTPAVAV